MAALSTLAAIGIGLAAKAFSPKPYSGHPTIYVPQKAPDPKDLLRQQQDAAQYAAAIARRRAQGQQNGGTSVTTGPAGLTTPAPVQRKTLLGQ